MFPIKDKPMDLQLWRVESDGESTLGFLFIDGVFECFTIEDEHRTVKKYGETRIPPGQYMITLRKEGGFHSRYSEKFPDIHKGMLWLRDVPNFEHILIHIGNRDDDTAGCILVNENVVSRAPEIVGGSSRAAYERLYPKIAAALETQRVNITILDMDRQSKS